MENIKCFYIHAAGFPERDENRVGIREKSENVCEVVMTEISPNSMKNINIPSRN